MSKYYIIPHSMIPVYEIEANSPEEAMEGFALEMDLDMNAYFKVVDELGLIKADLDESRRKYVAWAMNEVAGVWGVNADDEAMGVAEMAWDKYTEGDGLTEYEAIEWAAQECGLERR